MTKERLGHQEVLEEMPSQVSKELSEARVFQGIEAYQVHQAQLGPLANQVTTDLQDQQDQLGRPETQGSLGVLAP